MSLKEKVKNPDFWKNFARISIPFFIILVLMTLLWKNWSTIFAGDFKTVSEIHFANGKWKAFFGVKIVASILYGMYVTNKNMK